MKENRNVIIGSIILFLVSIIALADLTFGFIATGILVVFCILIVVAFSVVLIIAILKKKKSLIIRCGIVAISLFFGDNCFKYHQQNKA